MAKTYEAVSPDIRGKITAYKYVLSESLCRATERSSFGNPLRSFATVVVLRVHCAQSFRPTCATCTYAHTVPLYCARQREKKGEIQKKRRDRALSPIDPSTAEFSRGTVPGYRQAKRNVRRVFQVGWINERIKTSRNKRLKLIYLSLFSSKYMLKG